MHNGRRKTKNKTNVVEFPTKPIPQLPESKHVDLRLRTGEDNLKDDISSIFSWPKQVAIFVFDLLYQLAQTFIIMLFKPRPPTNERQPEKPHGRVAVIGAGLTGISTAAHCIAHNFNVVIYDKNPSVGGIWSNVNSSSGLQINSLIYRFHPSVFWRKGFPQRDEILGEIRRIWKEHHLESRTRLNTEVTRVTRAEQGSDRRTKWVVNDGADGAFDAVVCSLGTCGEPQRINFDGTDKFEKNGGKVVHSSELDTLEGHNEDEDDGHDSDKAGPAPKEGSSSSESSSGEDENNDYARRYGRKRNFSVKGKSVVIVGGGASAVEAAEWALEMGAGRIVLLAREDKWIIPRNVVFDTLLSMQPFGREMPLSFIPENIIRRFHYRELAYLAPSREGKGLFEGTPVVNDTFLQHVRDSRIEYVQGETVRLTEHGVIVKPRKDHSWSQTKAGAPARTKDSESRPSGKEEAEVLADVIVLATGFKRPGVDFLPGDLFPEGYERPNLYLQIFSTEDWSVVLTNASFENAIGTVGSFHIGIYTRILLTFLLDPNTLPQARDMKLWVDALRYIKRGAEKRAAGGRGGAGALGFFTYMELTIWLVWFHAFRLRRLKWMPFILFGWGVPIE